MSEVSNAEAVRLINSGVDEIYVSLGREGEVRRITAFRSYIDPRLASYSHPDQTLTLRNRPIGVLGGAEVWVKEWEPSTQDEENWASDPSGLTFNEWIERQRG